MCRGLVAGLQRIKQNCSVKVFHLWANLEAQCSCRFQLWNFCLVKFSSFRMRYNSGNTCTPITWHLIEFGSEYIFYKPGRTLTWPCFFTFFQPPYVTCSCFPTLKPRRIPFQTLKLPLEHQEIGGDCLFRCYFAVRVSWKTLLQMCRSEGQKVESI